MSNLNIERIKDITLEFKNQMEANHVYIESLSRIVDNLRDSESNHTLENEYTAIEQVISSYMDINSLIKINQNSPETLYNIIETVENKKSSVEFHKKFEDLSNQSYVDVNEFIINELLKRENSKIHKYNENISLYRKDDGIEFESDDPNFVIKLNKYRELVEQQITYKELLLRTSLISISNSFESLINNFVYLLKSNDKKSLAKKTLSFEEITNFESIEEIEENILEDAVQDILRGNQISWLNYISEKTGKGKNFFEDSDIEYTEKFEEYFLERNLITHNNSMINNTYINKTKKYKNQIQNYSTGEKLLLKEEYLLENLNLIYYIGLKACYLIMQRFLKGNDKNDMFAFLSNIAFSNLGKRPKTSILIYEMLEKEAQTLTMRDKLQFSINYLQSLKWNGDIEKFSIVHKKIDFTTAAPIHKMCLGILVDDFETAIKNLKIAVENDDQDFFDKDDSIQIRIQMIVGWPIFKEIKHSKVFYEFLESYNLKNEIIYF